MSSRSRSGHSPDIRSANAAEAFEFNRSGIHLNHGSYGAVPKNVRLEQDVWRAHIERNPTRFFSDELTPALRRMAGHAARRFGGRAEDWVFCENATAAANGILHSIPLREGDEILTTSHAYGAVLKAMALIAARRGARVAQAQLPAILSADDEILEIVDGACTPKTRLLVLDHITSATAAVLPVARIAALAKSRGVAVLVDGAHAPGQIALNVPAVGVDWYTGNAHKWLFAPRGCALLWTAPARQDITRPAVLSHGTDAGYTDAFDWIGTRDPSPWLCFETAALAHDQFGGTRLMENNRELAAAAADMLCEAWSVRATAPKELRGAMAALVVDESRGGDEAAANLRHTLLSEHGITVPVYDFDGRLCLRISAQVYNSMADYDALAHAWRTLRAR